MIWLKRGFFQAAVVSILLCGCTTWTLTKRIEKKLDSNYSRMLRAILNKSGRQRPTKQQLYGHLSHIMKTIQVRRTSHVGHCWRSRDELISDVPSHGRAKIGRPARTYIQQLCGEVTLKTCWKQWTIGRGWPERVRDIGADGMTWRDDDDDDEMTGKETFTFHPEVMETK